MKSKRKPTKQKKKTKLPSIKSLERKVWDRARDRVRSKYPWNVCYICDKVILEKKKSHTGHLFKKGSLPLQLKYDLRLLRPCCAHCNRFKNGNEAWYAVKVIEEVGLDSFMELVNDIRNTEDIVGVPLRREWLLNHLSFG